MRKSLSYKVLLSVLALSTINYASPANVLADVDAYNNYNVTYNGETVTGNYNAVYGNGHSFTFEGKAIEIFGSYNNSSSDNLSNINIIVNNSNVSNYVYGVLSETNSNSTITNNHVTINSSKGLDIVCGASSSGGKVTNNYITLNDSKVSSEVCGGASTNGEVSNNYVIINESTIDNINNYAVVRGGASNTGDVFENHVTVNGGTLNSVQGGFSHKGNVYDNHVTISNATITGSIVGGYNRDNTPAKIKNNSITIKGTTNISKASLHGYATNQSAANITAENNKLILDGWDGNNGTDNYNVGSLNNFNIIEFKNIKGDTGLNANSVNGMNNTQLILSSVDVTNLSNATNHTFGTITLSKTITDAINDFPNKIDTTDLNGWNFNDNETNGIYAGYIANATAEYDNNNNTIAISGNVEKSVLTGVFIDESGKEHYKGSSTPDDTTDDATTLTIDNNFKTNAATVAGVYAADSQSANGGVVDISGTTDWQGTVYAGYSEGGSASGNTINVLSATNAQNMTLKGYNSDSNADGNAASNHSGNTLNITGNGSTFESIEDFDNINFKNVKLNGADVLTLNSANLTDTTLNVESLASGETFKAGDTVTLISGNIEGTPTLTHDKVTAGLSQDLSVEEITNNSSVKLSVKDVSLNDQIDLVAENRAVAAAFVNQGTDLISDSLDTISRDSNYGVKTFAAVHGNRSKYDVNSDIKINGWSTIVGVGNAGKFDNGSEFSWGVFYENGSGNYRTYNEFNNEFFRGDGSLVYNGGGIAARYTNKNGVYTEGSLRAGMLKSDMDNALRDGAGNFYGYESESAYYGAHLGIGKIISLSESSDLDVYGKFFHTYTEGDSFKVAGDEFEFDSINSDRLRIGARITSNKENKFSTYYGLAYEYEFNGDADMTAQGLKAPTQSLQGSSVMAEVGFNYQPSPNSPWSFDLNMRGYTGERQGGSFNVQATYTF